PDTVGVALVNQASGTIHIEAGAFDLEFAGGGTVAGQAGVTTVLGDAGTQLAFDDVSFAASSSIPADTVDFEGANTVAGPYPAASATGLTNGVTPFTGTVQGLGANLTMGLNGPAPLDLSAASLPPGPLTFNNVFLSGAIITPTAVTVTGNLFWFESSRL